MPSQGSQGSQGQTGPLCLPLVKYSYATVSSDNVAPIPWIHLSSKQNLVAVFDTLRLQSSQGQITEQSVLKVMKGPETMVPVLKESLPWSFKITDLAIMTGNPVPGETRISGTESEAGRQ